jgi:hypothetical protein
MGLGAAGRRLLRLKLRPSKLIPSKRYAYLAARDVYIESEVKEWARVVPAEKITAE